MNPDAALLRKFVDEHSDAAFRELVEQQIDFVYGAALRQVGGDAHLAQEVVQSVFLDLARKARVLANRSSLAGWLYTSTRFAAAKALRSRVRRLNHETEAHAMQEILSSDDAAEAGWSELRPVIDAAMHELGEADREAILLRFFEDRPLAEVGAALGLAENSARMRVDRALEKLRGRLAKRGITSTAAVLGAVLANQPLISAPAGLAASIAGTSLAAAAVATGGIGAALWMFMSTTKLVFTTLGALALFGLGAFVGAQSPSRPEDAAAERARNSALAMFRDENRVLKEEIAGLRNDRATAQAPRAEAAKSADAGASARSRAVWRMLAELKEKKIGDPRITFLGGSGKLNDAFVQLFELTPAEHTALQQVVAAAREKLEALERANATVTREGDGKTVITIKPFAEAGGAVYDEILTGFAQTLGVERQAAFLALGAEQVEEALGYCGVSQRKVTISADPMSSPSRYLVVDENVISKGRSTRSSNYQSREELLNRVGTIAKLLPPDF